ncbi:MAG TPA: hypothetical protein DIC36_00355 [Gammaproteobacteria bacterium]|nr:hypothetical protein [Gammaproteobacteria bacterium]
MGDLQSRESVIRSLLKEGPVTWLHFDGDRIALEVLSDGDSPNSITLDAGTFQGILQHLHHEPPTAEELEAAIAVIEDALMPVIDLLPKHRCLVSAAPEIGEITKLAGHSSGQGVHLDIGSAERLFNRLADVSHGTPPAQLGMPAGRVFAASLLLLRELLHHARFESIVFVR